MKRLTRGRGPVIASLLATLLASTAGAVELPYVDDARSGEAKAGRPELRVLTSSKVELVMLAAALADKEQTINRPRPDNPLGTFWSGRSRALGFSDAPRHMRELRRYGLWGDSLLDFALRLSDPPALDRILPWSEPLLAAARAEAGDDPAGVLETLRVELRMFSEEARFMESWKEKEAEYLLLQQTLQQRADDRRPLEDNSAFWGMKPAGDLYLIPSALVSGGNMSAVEVAGRIHQFLVIGPVTPQATNEGLMDHLLFHELSHPLVDPVIKAHAPALKASSPLWGAISQPLIAGGIDNWVDAVGEHLLRAYNILRLQEDEPVMADLAITTEAQNGYLYARQFLAFLQEYAADRKAWPSLESYMPRLQERLDGMAAEAQEYDPARKSPEFEISNPGFEDAAPSWLVEDWNLIRAGDLPGMSEPKLAEVSRQAGAGREQGAALRVRVDSSTTGLLAVEQGPLAVRAGGTVRLSGWVKTEDVRREGMQQKVCGLYILFIDRQGDILSRGESDSAVGTLDWTPLRAEFVAPAGTSRVVVGVLLGMSGTAWFDDLAFERVD